MRRNHFLGFSPLLTCENKAGELRCKWSWWRWILYNKRKTICFDTKVEEKAGKEVAIFVYLMFLRLH